MMQDEGWSLEAARRLAVESVLRTDEVQGRRPRRSTVDGAYRVDCYRGNLVNDPWADFEPLSRRVYISVSYSDVLVALASFREWTVPFGTSEYDFWWAADCVSVEEGEMAYIACSYWSYDEWPPDFGSLVLFNRLAIRSQADPDRRALALVRAMIELEFGQRSSLMLLKAFPLEYESRPDHGNRAADFDARRSAMMRLYARKLGVAPFVDQQAFSGWMWRPLRYCPPPTTKVPNADWLS